MSVGVHQILGRVKQTKRQTSFLGVLSMLREAKISSGERVGAPGGGVCHVYTLGVANVKPRWGVPVKVRETRTVDWVIKPRTKPFPEDSSRPAWSLSRSVFARCVCVRQR